METQQVLVQKTTVQFNPQDPRYPGFPPTVKGHYLTFEGTQDFVNKFIQVWIRDPSIGYFRQLTTNMFLTDSTIFLYSYQLAMPQGVLCLLSEPFTAHLEYKSGGLVPQGTSFDSVTMKYTSDSIKSNMFTYEIGDTDIIGNSINLGPVSYPFSVAEAADLGVFNTPGRITQVTQSTGPKKNKNK